MTDECKIDTTPPQAPVLQCNSVSNAAIICTIQIFERALSLSLQLSITPTNAAGGVTRIITFSSEMETVGTYSISLPLTSLSGNINPSPLIRSFVRSFVH
jgi:hypothetical protein